ncbi:MAG: cytochrome c [Sporocytophaga sp.]|uniref:c-type cytochrome n=1 Tax=Sporocytophaga sp. TaxID=2231183 RepID=UPI001B168298|nr:cytochrome c [Sporocytophaga sp.]MBO9703325.1 cytochrome c [Sporocytophaga sp.]
MFPFKLRINFIILIVAFVLFTSCASDHSKKSVTDSPSIEAKNIDNDPFSKTTPESQYFDVNAEAGGIVESKNGLVISVPENAFLDNEGNVIKGSVRIELAEAFGIEEMILSGLETLTDKNKSLESDGMFYFKASANGKNVNINPKNPIYIESPVSKEKEGFMLYNGVRNKDGKIRWKDPKPMEKWLIPVDLELLDFYPEGFESAVAEGMPFRNYKTATKALTDSLYYSLDNGQHGDHQACSDYGIKPASIKVLKSKQFNNSLISTREFAARLKVIIKACDQNVLNIYINNLNKNLWECDSLAAIALQGKPEFEARFKQFAKEQLTKVKIDGSVKKLAEFYNKQLKATEKELDKIRKNYAEQLKAEDKKAEKMKEDYSKLLDKRLLYRMNKFGFILTKQGWENIDKEGPPTKIRPEMNVIVNDGNTFDRAHVYIINPMIKSIFALTSADSLHFINPYLQDSILLLEKEQSAVAIGIAYKDEKPYYGLQYFVAQKIVNIELNLKATTDLKLRESLAEFNRYYRKENSIIVDLAYQKEFYKEKQRQERLTREYEFIEQLKAKAFPCDCGGKEEYANGARLFKLNCSPCHALTEIVVGPALRGISKRRDMRWIVDFTRNSQKMIASGDPYAMELYNRFNKTEMKSFMELSKNDVRDIVNYIDCIPTSTVK